MSYKGCPECSYMKFEMEREAVVTLKGHIVKRYGKDVYDDQDVEIKEYGKVLTVKCMLCGHSGPPEKFGFDQQGHVLSEKENDDKDLSQTQ